MKMEKFEDWAEHIYTEDDAHWHAERTWEHQQTKIDQVLEYISLIGHQKELDMYLKDNYGRE